MFTHEQYLNDKNIRDKIIDIYEYSKETHKPDFINFVEDEFKDIKLDKIKKFIDCYIPITTCNFRCPYCYITQNNRWNDALPEFKYSAQYVRKALSKERLGGTCLLNMCGGGETLLPPYIIELLKELLEEGHYIFVVTNGTINKRFEEISKFPKNLLYRLAFKFSFHYKELIRINKMEDYFNNVRKMRDAGCSITVELTPYDDIIENIDDIKNIVKNNVGDIPHVTIARADNKKGIPILTKLSREEYKKTWEVFNSNLFNFKIDIFGKKMTKYCYAGKWSLYVNIGSGETRQCYTSNYYQNIFEDINKPINYKAIGKNCLEPHCYNAHSFLTLGDIPSLETPYYSYMRNRVLEDGSEWLNPYIKEIFSHKLKESNHFWS
ncbi:radical SAM protein [Brachyspira aalborgi]|uniref:Radical SAM protein n=2 Tax=Brachyspira aalborgi TaxID=29522 RepID=A0A5C8D9D3_9SPIR|nr:radical SAM protein [Brachyspira aalborgi]